MAETDQQFEVPIQFLFGVTQKELLQLMEYRGYEAVQKIIERHGIVEELCKKLKTDPHYGILFTDGLLLETRRSLFGKNNLFLTPSKSIFERAWDCFENFVVVCLLVSAAGLFAFFFYCSPEFSNWIATAAIVFAVLLLKFFKILGRGKEVAGHPKIASSVMRNGLPVDVSVDEIVVGDIVWIKKGDVLPADGLVIESTDLRVDESSMTGDSDAVFKSINNDPVLLSGTQVVDGGGKMLVIAVGLYTQADTILNLLNVAADKN